MTDTKRNKIKSTLDATRIKRASQECRVVKVKVDLSKCSKVQKEQLKMSFVQAKWLYNYLIDIPDCVKVPVCSIKTIEHFDKNRNKVNSPLTLNSIYKQSVQNGIKTALSALHSLKQNGYNVGRFKHISEYKSLSIPQFGKDQNGNSSIRGRKRVKVPGVRKPLYVNGLKQLDTFPKYEIADARLLNKPDGYYIAITIFINKDDIVPYERNTKIIGIDFGCQNTITTSEGEKINVSIGETEHLKRLQQKLARQKRGSNNRHKNIQKIRREYQKLDNKKVNATNQIVARLSRYSKVVIQDDDFSKWQQNHHGKAVQHSILGRLKSKIKRLDNVTVLDQYLPTSKYCSCCGTAHIGLQLSDRTFVCPKCGFSQDRDVHAAQNMIWFSQNKFQVPGEPRDFKPVECRNSDTMKQEAGTL